MKTTIQRWQDVAQKGDTCADLLPIVKEEAVRLYCALHAAHEQLGRPIDVKQRRRTVPPDCNDIRRFIVIRDEIVHLRHALDAAHDEIARTVP